MWTAVLLGSLGCYALKLAGLSIPERVLESVRVRRIAFLLPIALLSALIATQTFTDDEHFAFDARIAGVAAGAIAVWRRAPFLVVVALAAATAALVRLAT